MKIDQWDFRIIQHTKHSDHISVQEVKKIWAERCAVDVGIVSSFSIAQHLLYLIHDAGILGNKYRFADFITRLVKDTQKEDWDNFLYHVLKLFTMIPVVDIPGYEEFLSQTPQTKTN